ncbi:alpha/beta hydrolase [Pedobacter nutrimenti]|uniref:alpha/beta fold hydrolase n=1 Tax=Pedobacter nutrimenti TaxID=1241337 RepID=UPI00292F333F|nr:alpha/beta hydrolase [Pedobacter nutrimenti]
MKRLKQITEKLKEAHLENSEETNTLLWQYICYSPKIPLRLHQEQLLEESERFSLKVKDEFFSGEELSFNAFKWGKGPDKVILTHGWGSKAADFSEIIHALKELKNLEIIAFDAPGNGSSEGELSNLLLYIEAVKAIIAAFGSPKIFIGHSLGAMANVIAIKETRIKPDLLVSLTPLVLLKENFKASMTAVQIDPAIQEQFLKDFEQRFGMSSSIFNLSEWYREHENLNHWLAYDQHDHIAPYSYLKRFMEAYPSISGRDYEHVTHERIIRSAEVIKDLKEKIIES